MGWKLDFVPGSEQALYAGQYFNSVTNDLVDGVLAGMSPHHYRLEPKGRAHQALRIWAHAPPTDETVSGVVPLLSALRQDVFILQKGEDTMERVALFFQRWVTTVWSPVTLFIEKIRLRGAFTAGEELEMSIALPGGKLSMLSTSRIMFIEHAPGTFGLALAGHGSYLLENLDAHPVLHSQRP